MRLDKELSQEMKDEYKDMYDPIKWEGSEKKGKRGKNSMRSEYEPHLAYGSKGESGNEPLEGTPNTFEREPPFKKIKLLPSNNNKSNQEEAVELSDENQNEVESECEFHYENIHANFFAEELTSDDEIFTFQCPKNFDVKCLLNRSIDLSKYTKLKDDFNKYIWQTLHSEEKKIINCIFPSKEKKAVILQLPVVGHIVFRQILKAHKNNFNFFVDCEPEIVQLPDFQIMKRHPLLGTGWDDHLNKVRMHMKKHRKILKKSLKHEKSLEMYEKERKEKKKKLKVELALLKKKQILDTSNL